MLHVLRDPGAIGGAHSFFYFIMLFIPATEQEIEALIMSVTRCFD